MDTNLPTTFDVYSNLTFVFQMVRCEESTCLDAPRFGQGFHNRSSERNVGPSASMNKVRLDIPGQGTSR